MLYFVRKGEYIMSSFLTNLDWRKATKSFLKDKKIQPVHINMIKNAIKMAPSSFGLQPFYVKVIEDTSTKEKMRTHGWNQDQFTTAQYVFVFIANTNVEKRIDEYMAMSTKGDKSKLEQLKGYEEMMRGSFAPHKNNIEYKKMWAQKQIYIALGFAMAACTELKIDSCPMEGFDAKAFDKILNLPEGHFSTVVLTLGYEDPSGEQFQKFRFPLENLFHSH